MSLESRRVNMLKCDRCSNCKWMPTMPDERFASACPSIEYGQFHAYSAGGKSIMALAMQEGRIAECSDELLRAVYACSACGACDTACKWTHGDTVGPLETIYELRAEVVSRGRILPAHRAALDSIRANGNRYGAPRLSRAKWAQGLEIKNSLKERAAVLLHVGCENAFHASQWPELRAIVELLKRAGVDFGMLYDSEVDCGSYAFDIGFQKEAETSGRQLAELIVRSGAAHVVTCSASAYAAFRNIFPRFGISLGNVAVEHITQTAERLVSSGALTYSASRNDVTVTYHDSCKLGRLSEQYVPWNGSEVAALNQIQVTEPPRPVLYGNDGLYEAPRRLIDHVDVRRVEMPRNRQFSYCCGAQGGGKEPFPDFARHAAQERLKEAQATGASSLITACGACTSHLGEVASGMGLSIKVEGLFEHLANTAKSAPEVRK